MDLSSVIIIGIVVVLIIIVNLYIYSNKSSSRRNNSFPYHRKYILTKSEYKFYISICPLMKLNNFIICPKVGLKDLFEVNAGTKERQKYFAKISQKHVDFLICDKDLKPLFAIELDDKSHSRSDVKERDLFKNELFKVTDMPLYRVPVCNSYSEEYLKKYIPILNRKDSKGI